MKNHCNINQIPSPQCLSCYNYGSKTCPMFSNNQARVQWVFKDNTPVEKSILSLDT